MRVDYDNGTIVDEDGIVAGQWCESVGRWGKPGDPLRWYCISVNVQYRCDAFDDFRIIDFTDQLVDKGAGIVQRFHVDNGNYPY